MLTEYLPLPGDTPIIFWHPKIATQLVIQTGVSGISWEYALNTNTTPTFGGEVTQVLSSYIGPVTVHGQTRDNKQLRDIYTWFLHYMQIAGLRARNEEYVVMNYPTRGWSFWIMPNQLPNFLIDRDQIAVEWSMTAEVVADDGSSYDILQGMSMKGFWEASFDPNMFDVGFTGYNDPRNVSNIDPTAGQRIGDNMQSLIGSWASGDFMHFAVDTGHRVNSSQGLKSAQDYWSQILGGSDVLIGSKGSGSQALGSSGGVPTTRVQIAGAIASAFSSAGIPGYLAVASSIVESNLNPDARQNGGDSAMGLFQSFPTGAAGGQSHKSEVVAAFNNPGKPVTQFWSTLHQITDAVGWWSDKKPVTSPPEDWVKRAQGAGDPNYAAKVAANFDEAKSLIAQYQKLGTEGIRAGQIALAQVGKPYVWGGDSPATGFDCSGLCHYAWTQAGFTNFPRTSETQFNAGWPSVEVGALQPGDLLFEITDGSASGPGHVAMFTGDGTVVEAPHTGAQVFKETTLDFTKRSDYIGARRPTQ